METLKYVTTDRGTAKSVTQLGPDSSSFPRSDVLGQSGVEATALVQTLKKCDVVVVESDVQRTVNIAGCRARVWRTVTARRMALYRIRNGVPISTNVYHRGPNDGIPEYAPHCLVSPTSWLLLRHIAADSCPKA